MKKKTIIFGILAIIVLFVISLNITDRITKINTSENQKPLTGTTSFDQQDNFGIGEWSITSTWKNNGGSNIYMVNPGASATNNVEEIVIANNIHLQYTENTAWVDIDSGYMIIPFMMSNTQFFPVNIISSDLVDNIKERATNPTALYTYEIDTTNNKISFYKKINTNTGIKDTMFAYMEFSVPYIDNASPDDEMVWQLELSEFGDQVMITNQNMIDIYADYETDFDVTFHIMPSFVSTNNNANYEYSPRLLFFDQDLGFYNFGTSIYDPIFTKTSFANSLRIENVVKADPIPNETWNSAWGTNPSPAGDYVYILYSVDGEINGLNQFNNSLGDFNSISFTTTNGTLVAYGDGRSFAVGDNGSFNTDTTLVLPENDYNLSTYAKIINQIPTTTNFTRNFIVRYDNSGDQITDTATFTINATIPGESNPVTNTQTWNLEYTPAGDGVTYNGLAVDSGESLKGALNKINNNTEVVSKYSVEAGLDDINTYEDDTVVSAFNNNSKTKNGTKNYKLEVKTDKVTLVTMNGIDEVEEDITDFVVKSLIPKRDNEYDYNSDTKLVDASISTYGNKTVYAKVNGTWVNVGSYKKDDQGNINYTSSDNSVTINGVNDSNPIILPNNATEVKVTYEGVRAAVDIAYDVNIAYQPTDNFKNKIENKDEITLRTYFKSVVNDTVDSTESVDKILSIIESSTEHSLTSTFTTTSSSNEISYEYTITEQMEYDDEIASIVDQLFFEQTNAGIDILLPKSSTITDIVLKDINDATLDYTKSESTNYGDLNRTLIKLTANGGDNPNKKITGTNIESKYTLTFKVVYPHISNKDNGNIVPLDIRYVHQVTDGYTNSTYANDNSFSSTQVKTAFQMANDSPNKIYLFATKTVEVPPVASELGIMTTKVTSVNNDDYLNDNSVKLGASYKYKLEYTYTDPLTELSNVVIYDSLENDFGGNSYWQGIFESIDLRDLTALGISPTVYYSTTEHLELSGTNLDLTKREIWTTDKPANNEVKAIAVDCGDYEFKNMAKPTVYIQMKSILNRNNLANKAYNKSIVRLITLGEYMTFQSNTSTVGLEDVALTLEVTPKTSIDGTSYELGDSEHYINIDSDLGYLYTVTNTDAIGFDSLEFETKIEGLGSPVIDQIKYYTTDPTSSALLSTITDGKIVLDSTGEKLVFTINNLASLDTVNIFVPLSINTNELSTDNYQITSTSGINRLNGLAYQVDSIHTYHKASIPILDITHSTKDEYNNNIFSSSNTYINKAETITNMVKISNIGDITARNITIVETINGGAVDTSSITNGGVYSGGKITWTIAELESGNMLELTYELTLPQNIENNTFFTPSTNVKIVNPYDSTSYIRDDNLTYGFIVFRTISDIGIDSSMTGDLKDENKKIKYTIELQAPDYAEGSYEVVYSNKGVSASADNLVIDNTGKSTYTLTFDGYGTFLVSGIPNDITYTITQDSYPGYTTTVNGTETTTFTNTISGSTGSQVITTFVNDYNASTSLDLAYKTNYDKDLEVDMFKVDVIARDNTTYSATNDIDGNVNITGITYNNVEGTFRYTVKEEQGTNDRILYDSNIYTLVVQLKDNKDGTLSKTISYYDASNNKLDSVEFNNTFIRIGLLVKNNNTGDYINPNKLFNYTINITGATPDTTYIVTNQDDEEIGAIETDGTGKGTFTTDLAHDEYILIEELPVGSNYEIIEILDKYYESDLGELVGTTDSRHKKLIYRGSIDYEVTKVVFNNNYETKASFAPSAQVVLKDKELENNEFSFRITDVSDGVTQGYQETVTNDLDGHIYFSNINYTRPGTYQYEIEVINNGEKNINYDNNKLLLTLLLEDNEDGTMKVTSNYVYTSGLTNFVNTYSEEIIEPVVEPINNEKKNYNPNTRDSAIILTLISLIALLSIYLFRRYRISSSIKGKEL